MSESAARYQVDAQQYQQLLHELRQYRDAEQFPRTIPELRLRKGVITARDPATYTVSVLFGAADESAFPGVAVPGIRLADTVYPIIGASCFVAFNGPDPTVLFSIGTGVGAARVWKNSSGATTSSVLDAIGFGTVLHDTDSLWSVSNADRLTIGWPGVWQVGWAVVWNFGSIAGERQSGVWQVNSGSTDEALVRAREHQSHTAIHQSQGASTEAELAAGDWLELRVLQNSGGGINVITSGPSDEDYPVLYASWKAPPPP